MNPSHAHITELLASWNDGDETSLEALVPIVEQELSRIARNYLRRESPNGSLMTADLINEAYIKLIKQRKPQWQNRGHFFAVSSIFIRRILINHARDRSVAKRAGSAVLLNIDEVEIMSSEQTAEVLLLDESLKSLESLDPLKARVVELKYFGGLSVTEIADVMKLSGAVVNRHWKLARAWLAREMKK